MTIKYVEYAGSKISTIGFGNDVVISDCRKHFLNVVFTLSWSFYGGNTFQEAV